MKHLKAIVVIVALTGFFPVAGCSSEKEDVKLSAAQEEAMSKRLAPEGELALASDVKTAPAGGGGGGGGSRTGEEIYNAKCLACHASGAAGAPKLGAVDDWKDRIAKGMDVLYDSAINGFQGMVARGLCNDCSDEELKASVDYMVEKSQ